ncbi:MAG: 4Fe-4S dicluster domain-containing protein [Dehalococcoidia bacterium]
MMRIELTPEKLHGSFVVKVEEISGQDLLSCYQCGKCSAGCPMSFAMDILPNQIIRLAQLGMEAEIAESKAIWLCATCITCIARCPRGCDLSRVIEALRLLTLRKNADAIEPSRIPAETLAELPQIALVSCFRKFTA